MRGDDLLVSVRQRRLACILDPALVLTSPWGHTLALRLTQVMEPWLTRSFWQVIDASELVIPRLTAGCEEWPATDGGLGRPAAPALQAWIHLRDTTDAASWPFRWVGDNLAESQVGDATDPWVVSLYERLAETMERRFVAREDDPGRLSMWWDPLQASLDTLALSAGLGGALVLTAIPETGDPWPVQALTAVGVAAERLEPLTPDSLFAAERTLVRDALAAAGLASLAQRLPPLAALHVLVAGEELLPHASQNREDGRESVLAGRCTAEEDDPWRDGRAWWYYV